MTHVWHPGAVREDIAVRLSGDGLSLPIGELLQERAEALCEITRLRNSLGASVPTQGEASSTDRLKQVGRSGSVEMGLGSMLRLAEVCEMFSLSRSSIYTWIAQGRFPPPVRVGGRSVRWAADTLIQWRRGLGSATAKEATAGRACAIAGQRRG